MKKNNILNSLFACIIVNMFPTIMLGVFHVPEKIYVIFNALAYFIELIIMLNAISFNTKKLKINQILLLLTFLIIQFIVQIFVYCNQGIIIIQDSINSIAVFLNLLIFILFVPCVKITKQEVLAFMNKLFILGLIACLYNLIVNFNKLTMLKNPNNYIVLSSFFPNRNQFGIFLLIVISATLYIKNIKKSYIYIIAEVFFIINLLLTMSRTSIAGMIFLCFLKNFLDYKSTHKILKKQLIYMYILVVIINLCIVVIVVDKDYRLWVNNFFIRSENIKTASNRTPVWKNGIDMTIKRDPLFGIGRFNGINLNKTEYRSNLPHFHSLYIETFVSYGLLGIVLLTLLFRHIIIGLKESIIDSRVRNILLASVYTFLVISLFETTTRFSIGYVDTVNMIYFIVVPLLISSNNKKEKYNKEIKE